jgi:hypothetical protein
MTTWLWILVIAAGVILLLTLRRSGQVKRSGDAEMSRPAGGGSSRGPTSRGGCH